ncbi:bifunctional DNA primase/polymerase [Paracoccus hibiscisoli]|uniref:bifunctional DNA primase/polymerase n=1 Tax=Paracoccus hibiscisoli TaxID=2023261 RepID=UPI0023F08C5E|nr:bifunctional DNA primase/polymerase [Paracoccus hibiscisoli]
MGIFAEYQPLYASKNIPTFPLRLDDGKKKPAVSQYGRIGLPYSGQLALDFPEMDAFAFMAGRRTGLTIIDIDSPIPDDEDMLREVLTLFGDTKLITRTGSGGFHCYYKHAGEDRETRPDPQMPVDRLGGGVVAAAPSKGANGRYEFIRGSLADLDSLRPANLIQFPKPKLLQPVAPPPLITEGRNQALFNHLMKKARYLDDLADLDELAFDFANNLTDRNIRHAFTDAEIRNTAASVRRLTERGENRFGGEPHSIITHKTRDQLHELGPDAHFLHSVLTKWSGDKKQFPVANGMADHMPGGKWTVPRFREARNALIGAGIIKEVRKAYTGHAALFSWA